MSTLLLRVWVEVDWGAGINAVLSEVAVGVVFDLARVGRLAKDDRTPFTRRRIYHNLRARRGARCVEPTCSRFVCHVWNH